MRKLIHEEKIPVGKPDGNRSLGRNQCRWEDNITMNLKETK
jgi:hypothetical protein